MSARINRRKVLAMLALADAPAPTEVVWRDETSIRLVFASISDLRSWVAAETPGQSISERSHPRAIANAFPDDWHGWELYLRAEDTSTAAELDEQIREQLRAVADKPDAPQDGTR